MNKINKQMIISDIIAIDKGIIPILIKAGFHCVGCPSAQGETLEEAGFVHGTEVDKLVEDINAYLETLN